jgi:hypothetical protein
MKVRIIQCLFRRDGYKVNLPWYFYDVYYRFSFQPKLFSTYE